MDSYVIDPRVHALGVVFRAAIVRGVVARKKDPSVERAKKRAALGAAGVDLEADPILRGYHALFASVGATDGEAMASPEWLLQLIARRGTLPTINTVVDTYNTVSVERLIVASAHDLDALHGTVRVVRTTGREMFYPLGSATGMLLRAGEWAAVDDTHALCRMNCKQSDISKVRADTTNLFIYVQGNRATDETYVHDSLVAVCERIIETNGGEYGPLLERVEGAED
jgi:DNA/RNA-binding domain of Phe-tRNA-synthetase-like protein